MNSIFDSLFGSQGQQYTNYFDSQRQYSASQQMNNSIAQQQLGQYYNDALRNRMKPRWVINSVTYNSATEFAEAMWPDDEQARLIFILKHGAE